MVGSGRKSLVWVHLIYTVTLPGSVDYSKDYTDTGEWCHSFISRFSSSTLTTLTHFHILTSSATSSFKRSTSLQAVVFP